LGAVLAAQAMPVMPAALNALTASGEANTS